MSIKCAARYTMVLKMPDKKQPFIIFQCERDAHGSDDHYTTGTGNEGQEWKMSWTNKEIKREKQGGGHGKGLEDFN